MHAHSAAKAKNNFIFIYQYDLSIPHLAQHASISPLRPPAASSLPYIATRQRCLFHHRAHNNAILHKTHIIQTLCRISHLQHPRPNFPHGARPERVFLRCRHYKNRNNYHLYKLIIRKLRPRRQKRASKRKKPRLFKPRVLILSFILYFCNLKQT